MSENMSQSQGENEIQSQIFQSTSDLNLVVELRRLNELMQNTQQQTITNSISNPRNEREIKRLHTIQMLLNTFPTSNEIVQTKVNQTKKLIEFFVAHIQSVDKGEEYEKADIELKNKITKEFSNTAWESEQADKINEKLIVKIIKKKDEKKKSDSNTPHCTSCGKMGHFITDCWKRQKMMHYNYNTPPSYGYSPSIPIMQTVQTPSISVPQQMSSPYQTGSMTSSNWNQNQEIQRGPRMRVPCIHCNSVTHMSSNCWYQHKPPTVNNNTQYVQ